MKEVQKQQIKDAEWGRGWETFFFVSEIAMLVCYLFGTRYQTGVQSYADNIKDFNAENAAAIEYMQTNFSVWQDINVMTFVGYGFLKVFLRTHSWSAVGFNFLLAAMACQWSILCYGFWNMMIVDTQIKPIPINVRQLIEGNYGASAALISMNALVGKASFPQLYLMIALEMIFYGLNKAVILGVLHAVDLGGSMTIHMFGAYFGLTATFFFKSRRAITESWEQSKGNYNSQLISMVGTLFLFVYWPSFNSALAVGVNQQRAALNTFFSITTSALTAGYISRCVTGKLDMEVIMNATLAGGVMIAAACDMIFNPGFAMLVGGLAGIASSLGYLKLNYFMQLKVKMHDTCGVQFLHGIPGMLGAVTSACAAGLAIYNYENEFQLKQAFPPVPNRPNGRGASEQAWIQMAAMGVALGISIFSGALCAFLAGLLPHPVHIFDDDEHFDQVYYGDDLDKYNAEIELVDTARTESAEPSLQNDDGKDQQFEKNSDARDSESQQSSH